MRGVWPGRRNFDLGNVVFCFIVARRNAESILLASASVSARGALAWPPPRRCAAGPSLLARPSSGPSQLCSPRTPTKEPLMLRSNFMALFSINSRRARATQSARVLLTRTSTAAPTTLPPLPPRDPRHSDGLRPQSSHRHPATQLGGSRCWLRLSRRSLARFFTACTRPAPKAATSNVRAP